MFLRLWWRSSRSGCLFASTLFGFPHDIAADECIINRVSNLLMDRIWKPHARVFNKTLDETREREASLSFTFALEGNLLHFIGNGPGYIHFYALKDVVNYRADLDHTIREVVVGDDNVEVEFLDDFSGVGQSFVLGPVFSPRVTHIIIAPL